MRQSVVALITARGGSKGVPGKNLRPFCGKPLLAWTIEAAKFAPSLCRTIVSTDDPMIADIARQHGAEVPFLRPAALARDNSPHLEVVLHALDWLAAAGTHPDYLLLLQPTSPLREALDIEAAIAMLEPDRPRAIISVNEMQHHPYFSRAMEPDGTLKPLLPMPQLEYPRRQDLPPAYFVNGAIFLNRCDSLRHDRTFYPPGAKGYVMPCERSVQIDTLLDFHIADAVLTARRAASHTP